MFQYTVTAALLGSYVARHTSFLGPSSAAARDMDTEEELGRYATSGDILRWRFL